MRREGDLCLRAKGSKNREWNTGLWLLRRLRSPIPQYKRGSNATQQKERQTWEHRTETRKFIFRDLTATLPQTKVTTCPVCLGPAHLTPIVLASLISLKNIAVWTMKYIVNLPETLVLHRASIQSGMDLQTCTCVGVCVLVSPDSWESWSETRHSQNGRHFQELLSTGWDSNLRMIHRNHFPNSRMALTWCMICSFAVGKPGSDNSWKRFFPLCLFCSAFLRLRYFILLPSGFCPQLPSKQQ